MKEQRLETMKLHLQPIRDSLIDHPLYREIDRIEKVRVLMQYHVFAVWDFMSLLKALQQRICGGVPWRPPKDTESARLINEIVLAEETDEDNKGGHASHFELYYRAMVGIGAETACIDSFLDRIEGGASVPTSIMASVVPPAVQSFVNHTFQQIEEAETPALASAFTFGREELLPCVFRNVLTRTDTVANEAIEPLKYYLQRHIDLDGDEHGPMAETMVSLLCGEDTGKWESALAAAKSALWARRELWDGIYEAMATENQVIIGLS